MATKHPKFDALCNLYNKSLEALENQRSKIRELETEIRELKETRSLVLDITNDFCDSKLVWIKDSKPVHIPCTETLGHETSHKSPCGTYRWATGYELLSVEKLLAAL